MNERKVFSFQIDIVDQGDGHYQTHVKSQTHTPLSFENVGRMYGLAGKSLHQSALASDMKIKDTEGAISAIQFGHGYIEGARGINDVVASKLAYKTRGKS